jgi:hypothetical protein
MRVDRLKSIVEELNNIIADMDPDRMHNEIVNCSNESVCNFDLNEQKEDVQCNVVVVDKPIQESCNKEIISKKDMIKQKLQSIVQTKI